jgi:UDP-N-acetylglucosamine 2-epimerase
LTRRKIALATANRAERGLLEPVIKRLQERKDVRFDLWELPFSSAMARTGTRPDVVLVPADRQEMVPLAESLYYGWQVPIFHMWAGLGSTGTWDDLNRRILSSFAYLMFCEDKACRRRLIDSGEEPWRCIVTGTTHFDDLVVDDELVPGEPYDLVLLKPNPVDRQDENDTVTKTLGLLNHSRKLVWIGPADSFEELVIPPFATHYPNLPRPQFLGLLQHCERYISNSSSTAYEAPFFSKKVVNPGKRNKGRKTGAALKPGASDKIVDLLVNYPLDKAKLLKVYR